MTAHDSATSFRPPWKTKARAHEWIRDIISNTGIAKPSHTTTKEKGASSSVWNPRTITQGLVVKVTLCNLSKNIKVEPEPRKAARTCPRTLSSVQQGWEEVIPSWVIAQVWNVPASCRVSSHRFHTYLCT